jgi:hypothetical protein
LAWISDVKDAQFHLHASANASLKITSKGIEGLCYKNPSYPNCKDQKQKKQNRK